MISSFNNRLLFTATGNVEKMSLDKKKDYPLIFPDGKMMKPEEVNFARK